MADLGITTGGDALSHVLDLGTDEGGAFTPDGIAAAVERVHAQIRVISKEAFDSDAMPDDLFNDWSRFVLAFTQWKTSHSSWLSRAWNETRAELLDWVSQYEALRVRWSQTYQTQAAPFEVRDAPGGTLESLGTQVGAALKHVAIGVGVLAGVVVGGYLAWRMVRA